MAILALLGGDRFATIGGVIAMLLGPVVYLLLKSATNRRQRNSNASSPGSMQAT
jgi:hypothetical protein